MKHVKRIALLLALAAGVVLLHSFAGADPADGLMLAESDQYCAVRGDVNKDGRITAADARTLLRCAVRLEKEDHSNPNAYLVDNSSQITAADARLALRIAVSLEARPAHAAAKKVTLEQATCQNSGITWLQCKYCGDLYNYGRIPQKEHLSDGWKTVQKPTCSEKGKKEQRCIYCNKVMATASIPQTPHIFGDFECEDGAPLDCEKTQYGFITCLICGEKEYYLKDARPHDFNDYTVAAAPTCTEAGKRVQICAVCGMENEKTAEILPALGHAPGDWIESKTPTYDDPGQRVMLCTRCGEILQTEEIPKLTY